MAARTATARKSVPAATVSSARPALDAVVGQPKPAAKRVKAERGLADAEHVARLLGIKVTSTEFPGMGKAVKVEGARSIYVNAGSADVMASKEQVQTWAEAGHGVVRGTGTCLRVAL